MKKILIEIYQELTMVLKGKTLDTLIPPIIFAVTLNIFNLVTALFTGLIFSFFLFCLRVYKKEKIRYAILGILAVGIAAVFSYLSQSPITYFIPDILGSALSLIAAFISILIGKPLVAYVSHLTRGWPIDWFLRDDIKPAYLEVTWIWTAYFLFRTVLETLLYISGDVNQFVWVNTLLGLPLLIGLLTMSYIYGLWRLKKLGGPSVDEHLAHAKPPFKGQLKGF